MKNYYKEEKKWIKEYDEWLKKNDKLPNTKTADEVLEMPRPKSDPPKLKPLQYVYSVSLQDNHRHEALDELLKLLSEYS